MFFNILYSAIVSIIIIFVVHNIFNYFKNTLTTPKIKDLINKPRNEYDKIKNVINSNGHIDSIAKYNNDNISTETQSIRNNVDRDNIKSELKDFFKQLNEEKKDSISFNPVSNIENISSSNINYDTLNSNTMNAMFTNF